MRVIAGRARSMPLKTPYGYDTRPTTDRIKETLFNMLNPYIPEADFLDLFAGSGQIGIEALSRGARSATFVEREQRAMRCIEDNVEFTKFKEQSRIVRNDVLSFVSGLSEVPYDLIFMDPPYGEGLERRVLEILSTKKFVYDTLLVIEADTRTDFDYIDSLGFRMKKAKVYKTNQHVFIERTKDDE